ncbi:hypothetical protein NSS94_25750 [Paenibacillus sp. FSL L8-0644]|uniref:hypothetical protein n=1 Tax=Paenibacillus sp. FSL L8-0644 TaxID=2954523 RepID=UPI0030FB0876
MGWFTNFVPGGAGYERGADLSQRIKQVKEGLRRIPQKGIGYGMLRYLSAACSQSVL